MKRYAILCGSAPDGQKQKKIEDMYSFLVSDAGGAWADNKIIIFPNGVSEAMLNFVLTRLLDDENDLILIYVCTVSPVAEGDSSFWLCGDEIKKSFLTNPHIQVIFDSDRTFVKDEELVAEGCLIV